MAKLVYVPPPDPIPHAIPLMVAGAELAFQLGRIGIHILRGPGAVAELGGKVNRWLALEEPERRLIGKNIAESADRNWSWQGVARDVISASAGEVRRVDQA